MFISACKNDRTIRRAVSPWFAFALGAIVGLGVTLPALQAQDQPSPAVYELRTYYTHPGKLDALHARFRDHTVKLFEKHGMTNIGYWVPVDGDGNTLIYLLGYPSREDRDKMWKAFFADPDWKAAYAASTADGKLVAKVEQRFLEPTAWSPTFDGKAADPVRLFEMRTYTTRENRLDALHARFRDHTVKLFEKHGMQNGLYFDLLEEEKDAPVTLLYFLAHQDAAARDASFAAFREDPDWQAAREASEADGKILIKGGVASQLLKATDYSPIR